MFQDIEGKIERNERAPQDSDYLIRMDHGKVLLKEDGFLPTLAECGLSDTIFGKYGSFSVGGKTEADWTENEDEGARLQYLLTYEGKAFYALLVYRAASLFFAGDTKLEYKAMRTLFVSEEQGLHFAAATACHLAVWYQENRYCGHCGTMRIPASDERALICPSCETRIYPAIAPVVIVGALYEGKLLLTRYADPRGYRRHALVAGFCEVGEALEDTVRREVYEEAGLHVTNITYYKSQPWAFSQSLLAGFFCRAVDGKITLNTDGLGELAEAVWMTPDEIEAEDNALALTWTMIRDFKADPQKIMDIVS